MKKTIKLSFIMGLLGIAPGQAIAQDCPLHKRADQQAATMVTVSVEAPRLENQPTALISTLSSPAVPFPKDNLPASSPFEVTENTDGMTAGARPSSAPLDAPAPALLLSSSSEPASVLMAEAPPDSDMMMTPESNWNAALEKYVKAPDSSGLAKFDYAGLQASQSDQKALADYIAALEESGPSATRREDAIVYWANLYNAVTIKEVIDNYPVSSIKKIKSGVFSSGPWKKDLVTINGEEMSLDDIEHETLRKRYPSPLIHYMVNCASVGCPNLKNGLWMASTLDEDREAAARAYINSPRGAKITSKGLVVSSIYDWFKEDFGGDKEGVLEHLSQYAEGDLKTAIENGAEITDHNYDWSLNE